MNIPKLSVKLNDILVQTLPICLEMERQKKHVSLIFHKNKLVSIGINQFKTHPLARKYGYVIDCVHSELDAFNKLPKSYKRGEKRLKLINFRMNRFQQLRNSKPCKKCLSWCVDFFDEIWYTDDEGFQELEI